VGHSAAAEAPSLQQSRPTGVRLLPLFTSPPTEATRTSTVIHTTDFREGAFSNGALQCCHLRSVHAPSLTPLTDLGTITCSCALSWRSQLCSAARGFDSLAHEAQASLRAPRMTGRRALEHGAIMCIVCSAGLPRLAPPASLP